MTINFGPAGAAEAASQAVSPPLARSPAALVVYAAHATHALFDTRSFAPHAVAAHAVSIPPDGSSPAARVVPAGHAVQLPDETCWFDAQRRAVARRIRLRGVVAGGVRRRPGTRDARVGRHAFIRRAQSRRTRRIAAVHRIARGARRSRRTRDARAARHALVRRARRPRRSSQRDRLSRHRALPGGVPGRNIHARHAREIRGRRPRERLRSRSARVRVLLRRPAARLRGESRHGGRRPRARVRERRDAKPVSVIVIESFGPYVDALAVTNDPTLGVAPIIVAFVMMSTPDTFRSQPTLSGAARAATASDEKSAKNRRAVGARARATRRRAHADASVAR